MLRLRLLGRPSVTLNDRPVGDFRSQKIEALLYYLATSPGAHPRHRLADLLWPDQPEKTALGNVRYALWNIKQVVADAPLTVTRATAAFSPGDGVWVDALAFAQQRDADPPAAIALYRGDFLSGFELLDSPPFNDWLRSQQSRYRAAALGLLEQLAAQHLGRQRLDEAIAATRRLLELDPWHEKSHRQLMWLLAATGQRGAAIEQYRLCCRLLADELGLEPEPETSALFQRIRRGEPLAAPAGVAAPVAPAPATPFLGRAAEQDWLLQQWQLARRGDSRLALIGGEAGIGKTRLVTETAHTITAQGGLLLHGRCFEYSGPVAYQPIAEALRPLLLNPAQPWQPGDIWLAELAQLAPELRELYPRLPLPLATDRYRLFEAARQLVRQLAARQPLALFVDDLHWADTDSLDLLGYLVQQCDRLLLIGAYRPEETPPRHPLPALRDGLYRAGRVAELALARLPAPVVAQLVAAARPATPGGPIADLLYRVSDGNPFILLETLRELRENSDGAPPPDPATLLPQTVQATIQRRLNRLPPESAALLSLAAVVGREFEAGLLQSAGAHPPAVVLDALDDWLSRQLVRSVEAAGGAGPHRFDFTHDLIRTVAVGALSPPRRQALHRQVALALQQRQQSGAEVSVEWLAHHFHQANLHAEALAYLRQAGQQARAVFALPLALARYRQAAHHWAQLYRIDDPGTPPAAYRERWELQREQAELLRLSGRLAEAQRLLDDIAAEIDRHGDDSDRLPLLVAQVAVLHQLDDVAACRRLAESGLQLAARALDAVAEGACHTALGHCARRAAAYGIALSHYEAALISYTQAGETAQSAACLQTIAATYLSTNQFERALACVQEAIAYARSGGAQDVLAEAWLLRANVLLWLGQLDSAAAAVTEATTLAGALELRSPAARGLALRALLQQLTGEVATAGDSARAAVALAGEAAHPAALSEARFCCGVIALADGQPQTAQAEFEAASRENHLPERRRIELLSYRAIAALALGQAGPAAELSREAVARLQARQNGLAGAQRVHLHHARILTATGNHNAAGEARRAALALARQQAAAIPDAEMRRQFWQLPWNVEARREG